MDLRIFNHYFFKCFSSIVRSKVLATVHEVFRIGKMPSHWKNTYIILIQKKKENLGEVMNYRLISLCNTLYKLVAKLIVNRLKPLIPNLVFVEHGVFVPNRNNSENMMIAQEIFHSMSKATSYYSLSLIKVDMEKAYDRMS